MNLAYTALSALAALAIIAALMNRLTPIVAARLALNLDRLRSRVQRKQVELDGFSMPYLEGGQGEVLVLIHGFAADKDNFTRIARFLTPHYRVICPDLPGFGEASRDPAAGYSIAEQVTRLHAFLKKLGIDKVHLGGNSMGGYIAAQYAGTYPQQVASVWLLDPAGTHAAYDTAIVQRYQATGEAPLLVRREEDFAALINAATHRMPFFPHCVLLMLARRAVADYPLHRSIMQQFTASPLLEEQFQHLATPAFIVWGKQDQLLNPAGAETLRKLFTHSQVSLMDDIGHMPMLETPGRSAREYLAFRKNLQAQPAR